MNLFYLILLLDFSIVLGYDCDFEIPCDWEWHSESGFGVATVANFSTPSTLRGDADNNPSGHFLYYPMENGSVTHNITSPWFPNGSLPNCTLEVWYHMYNMDEGIIKILVKSNDNITTEVGIISGNNHTTWEKHVQTIRSMSKPIHLVIEIVNRSEGIFPSHVAIDNIRFLHCLPKQLEVAECNSHYYLCPEDVCIYRHQVCDISKDCLNGEDEQEDCNQIPRSAFCDFETDTCKWTGNSTQESSSMSNWTRQSGPVSIRQERFGLYYDHTYKNESGHYMFPKYKSRYSFGTNNYLNSDIFHPPPIYHRTIQSSYYNTCQVRFFVYIHRRSSVPLVLNCVVLDPLYHNGRVIQLWDNKGHFVERWEKIVLSIPAIKHSYYLQFVVTRSLNSNPIVAIDDVTLSPECFGIGKYKLWVI
ncbi:MAM and LDL-receptor class A domain-containing protein 2-like [Centruroides sculpturatus]|uniref:MAM and LDL-receptor class A domain-containing protein 2-like n=1 Tax=Centruroides sculpturatus TaxID=218467 RepID=UPI000C6E3EFC|nr:MAM and LDL-receptor class A domain-containing protein 2-like [Centruroides sculpturatus]